MKVWTGLSFLLAFAATTGDNNRRRGMELQNKQNVNNRNYFHYFGSLEPFIIYLHYTVLNTRL